MKHLAALLLFAAAPALAAPPAGFAERVEKLRAEAGVPGLSVAIVEQGRPTMAQGFGVRKLGGNAKVDEHTIFQTGSTGKALTAAALALLVDQGKIGWDDPVIDHIPWFRMYDAYVTREITVRDLLVHRSGLGLGAGDLMFVPRTNLSRKESVKRIANIKPATSFRSGYAYDNILYMVAGQLIEEVTGQSWENFVQQNLLTAGGMKDGTTSKEGRLSNPNHAAPHARMGALRGVGKQEPLPDGDELGRNAAPAGGIAMSADDWTRWIGIQLAKGALPEGGRLFSEAQSKEMWTPVVIQPVPSYPDALKAATPNFRTYALGWDVSDYRGVKIVSHGGAVFGSQTVVALIPEKDVGFAVQINSEDGWLLRGLMYELLDHYLDQPAADWPAKWQDFVTKRQAAAVKTLGSAKATAAKVGPSLPLASFAGTYRDAWYGDVVVGQTPKGLTIDFRSTPDMRGTLEHYQYDTFVTRFTDKGMEPALVTFSLDADGKVDRVTMKAENPIADFSWDYHDLLLKPVEAKK